MVDKKKSVDLGCGVVVVRNVPAKICAQCGEEWIESEIAKELERVVNTVRQTRCQLEVIPFQSAISKRDKRGQATF